MVSADRAARAVVRAVDRPRRTVRVGPYVLPSVLLHRCAPALYDVAARQASARLGLDAGEVVAPTPGATLEPDPDADREKGPRSTRRPGWVLGRRTPDRVRRRG